MNSVYTSLNTRWIFAWPRTTVLAFEKDVNIKIIDIKILIFKDIFEFLKNIYSSFNNINI